MSRILFAEDEAVLGKLVREALEREPDFQVTWVRNGRDAVEAYRQAPPDLCILDVMMPVTDGFAVAKTIRMGHPTLPILFLTARSQTADVVKGFESGGNDYLRKPFSLEELVVRVRELLRRTGHAGDRPSAARSTYEIGAYTFNPTSQQLRCEAAQFQLSGKETELLTALVQHKNSLLERKPTLLRLWGDDTFFNARSMDVYIARLRKYLAHDPDVSIVNIRGHGFKLIVPE